MTGYSEVIRCSERIGQTTQDLVRSTSLFSVLACELKVQNGYLIGYSSDHLHVVIPCCKYLNDKINTSLFL